MAVTLFEKLLLASLYRHVNDLAQRLDGLFQSGAGEEYLSRLVKASESSAAQTAMLKDALVNDLKVILTDLTERQIAATAAGHKATGGQISEAIRESMTEPLERIAEAAGEVKKDQGSAVQQLLTDVLAQFSSQLESMLGSQIRGINDLQVQTMERLAAALSQFEQMAKSIRESSGDATRDMTEQVRALVEQLRQSSRTQSEETEVAMKAALAAFAKQTEELIQRIQNQAAAASAQHESRQQQFAEHSQQTLDGLSSQVRGLAGSVSNAVSKLEGTAQAVHAGATSLQASANRFAEAGKEVGNVMDRAATVSKRLIEGVDAISTVTAALASAVAEHRATRDSLAQVVGTAKDVVEIARRDAALTTELVGHLKSAADRLAAAEKQADEYLERVSEVLAEAHDVFTKTLTNAVRESSTEFHKALSNATARLKDAIEALSETLDNVAMK
jgi:ABC-type transporter Mla subunit MlaD